MVRWMSQMLGRILPASLGWGRGVGGEYRNILEIQLQGCPSFRSSHSASGEVTFTQALQTSSLEERMKRQRSPHDVPQGMRCLGLAAPQCEEELNT